jgi:5-methylcytosine-specific restriction endonuclease McrA
MMRHKLCRCGGVREDRSGSVCTKCGAGTKHKSRSSTQYGYDRRWRLLSERIRNEQPLCEMCAKQGIATAATEVHHIIPIDEAPWLRLERSNLMCLCNACHKIIHTSLVGNHPVWKRIDLIDNQPVVDKRPGWSKSDHF